MAINRATDRNLWIRKGLVKTTGNSIGLTKGELALVDIKATSPSGVKILDSTIGIPKNKKALELRVGKSNKQANRSHSNRPYSTIPFSINDIEDLKVSFPKTTEITVDEVILGWDGITPNSSFNLGMNDSYKRITLELEGDAISYLGGGTSKEVVSINFDVPHCDPYATCEDCDECASVDCGAWTKNVIDTFNRHELFGKPLSTILDITPVFAGEVPSTETLIPFNTFEMSSHDTGDDNALALVQSQYDAKVARTGRRETISTYQLMQKGTETAPASFKTTLSSIIKGCDSCPDGYDEVEGGIVYSIMLEDNGTDETTLVETLANAVTGSAKRGTGNYAGLGSYIVLTTSELTDAQKTAFLTAGTKQKTATIHKVGTATTICSNDTVTEESWTEVSTCNAVEKEYTIILPNADCQGSRLEELQKSYPYNVVTEADSDESESTITVTGTSGTATVTIDGENYVVTFATDIATTLSNFVTAFGTTIESVHGTTVSATATELVFEGKTVNVPVISNTTGDLDGAIESEVLPVKGGCAGEYSTKVISNIVCEECDPIFKDFYRTDAPENFGTYKWEENVSANSETEASGTSKCGIRFKAKPFLLNPSESFRDSIVFTEGSLLIRVAGGYVDEVREAIGKLPKDSFNVTRVSRFKPRTHLGGNMSDMEKESMSYFGDERPGDLLKRQLRGTTTVLENTVQYVDYQIKIKNPKYGAGIVGMNNKTLAYHIFAEVGRHEAVENLLNDLASARGLETVKAFA